MIKEFRQKNEFDNVFTYQDLNLPPERSESVIKILNRLITESVIAKISKGRFYKPKKYIFRTLKSKLEGVIKDFLEKDREVIGYMTEYLAFNRIPVLQLLDTIKFIKEIPDMSISRSCKRIMAIIQNWDNLFILAKKYLPVRALLGAMIESLYGTNKALLLWKTLNPLTFYNIRIEEQVLSEVGRWKFQ